MSSEPVQHVEQEKVVEGNVVLSFSKPTPMFATWVFRIVFILTGVATFIVLGDGGIENDVKIRLALYLKGIDMAVWAITRSLGVDVSRDYNVPNT